MGSLGRSWPPKDHGCPGFSPPGFSPEGSWMSRFPCGFRLRKDHGCPGFIPSVDVPVSPPGRIMDVPVLPWMSRFHRFQCGFSGCPGFTFPVSRFSLPGFTVSPSARPSHQQHHPGISCGSAVEGNRAFATRSGATLGNQAIGKICGSGAEQAQRAPGNLVALDGDRRCTQQ